MYWTLQIITVCLLKNFQQMFTGLFLNIFCSYNKIYIISMTFQSNIIPPLKYIRQSITLQTTRGVAPPPPTPC